LTQLQTRSFIIFRQGTFRGQGCFSGKQFIISGDEKTKVSKVKEATHGHQTAPMLT